MDPQTGKRIPVQGPLGRVGEEGIMVSCLQTAPSTSVHSRDKCLSGATPGYRLCTEGSNAMVSNQMPPSCLEPSNQTWPSSGMRQTSV